MNINQAIEKVDQMNAKDAKVLLEKIVHLEVQIPRIRAACLVLRTKISMARYLHTYTIANLEHLVEEYDGATNKKHQIMYQEAKNELERRKKLLGLK